MPRRTQAQILVDEAQNFLHFINVTNSPNGGPIRTDRSAEARAVRREQRNAARVRNYDVYRERLDRRNRNRQNLRNLRRFVDGQTEEAHLQLTSQSQIQRFLDRMLPLLEQGERFILNNGNRYFTLTNEKYIDIQNWLTSTQIFGDGLLGDGLGGAAEHGSDLESQDNDFYTNMTVSFRLHR